MCNAGQLLHHLSGAVDCSDSNIGRSLCYVNEIS